MNAEGLKLQHQDLLFTICGLYADLAGGRLPVSALVEMLVATQVKAPAARSMISRLKRSEILINERVDGESTYRLAPMVLDNFRKDDQQIFAPIRSSPDDSLILVIFSVPESQRNRRYELRTELTSYGFGMVAGGVAVGPQFVVERVMERLHELDLHEYVDYFRADYIPKADIRQKVSQWWDLDALDEQYTGFLQLYVGRLGRWKDKLENPETSGEELQEVEREAFEFYVPLLTRWRRFPYRDPNLPFEYLPDGWKAPQAKKTFLALNALLAPVAERYAYRILGASVTREAKASIQARTSSQ